MTQLRLTVAQISVLVLRCEHTFGPSEEENVLFVPPLDPEPAEFTEQTHKCRDVIYRWGFPFNVVYMWFMCRCFWLYMQK